MFGSDSNIVCVAGKNQCAIDALKYLINKKRDYNIVSLINSSDTGSDSWQKSFKHINRNKTTPPICRRSDESCHPQH